MGAEPTGDLHLSVTQFNLEQPVVFLDLDGVLCLAGTGMYALPGRRTFDSGAISALRGLVVQTKAKLVLTSSWRKRQADLTQATKLLHNEGFTMAGHTVDIEKHCRDEEIVAWLTAEKCTSQWVVLDDSLDKFAGAQKTVVAKKLVLVDASKGFTAADADRALKILR